MKVAHEGLNPEKMIENLILQTLCNRNYNVKENSYLNRSANYGINVMKNGIESIHEWKVMLCCLSSDKKAELVTGTCSTAYSQS